MDTRMYGLSEETSSYRRYDIHKEQAAMYQYADKTKKTTYENYRHFRSHLATSTRHENTLTPQK